MNWTNAGFRGHELTGRIDGKIVGTYVVDGGKYDTGSAFTYAADFYERRDGERPYKVEIARGLPTLDAAKQAAEDHWRKTVERGSRTIADRYRTATMRPLYEVSATIPMTHGTDNWTVKGHTVKEAFEALQASIRTARMMTIPISELTRIATVRIAD